jgi:hypothetical protein
MLVIFIAIDSVKLQPLREYRSEEHSAPPLRRGAEALPSARKSTVSNSAGPDYSSSTGSVDCQDLIGNPDYNPAR